MATAEALWVLRLIDRVTGPSTAIDRAIDRLERRTRSTSSAQASLAGQFRSTAAAGEASARRIETAWGRVSTTVRGSHQDMRSMIGTLATITAGVAAAGYAGKRVLDMAGLRESNLSQIGFLLKTTDQNRIMGASNWINRFADITPFTDQQAIKSVRQIMSYGFNFDQMKGLATVTGDAASIVGSDPEDAAHRWGLIIRAIGQIKSKGRVQQQELNQIQEHGIAANAYLDAAFGPNRQKMQLKGQISAEAGIKALMEGMARDFGGGMLKQSQTLFGLTSTLISRPQRIIGTLAENGGLDDLKRFFRNVISLTDFEKDPGKRALRKMADSGRKLTKALFGPLADGTEGPRAEAFVDNLVRKMDEVSDWWTTNGPKITREARGFADGLKAAGDGATTLMRPLTWLAGLADRASGGDGQGMLGKILGVGVGAVILGRLGNFLTFGLLGKLGAKAGQFIMGGMARAWRNRGFFAWMGRTLLGSARGVGWMRALGLTELTAGFGAAAAGGLRMMPVIGWIVTGLTAVKALGDAVYDRWSAFADLVDSLKNSGLGKLFLESPESATGFNRVLHFDPVKWATGKPQAWEAANSSFGTALTGMAGRLGLKTEDLLAIMNFESGLDPSKINRTSGATGLIQFLPDTARELGTTTAALRNMSREQQLPFVERYLKMHGVRAGMSREQLYMSILRGNPTTGALWRLGSEQYKQNSGLDVNNDGVITSAEALQMVNARWARDGQQAMQQLNFYISGDVDPAAVEAIRRATQQSPVNIASEGGL